MRPPDFWSRDGAASILLAPAGALYGAAVSWRAARAPSWRAPVPVVCVGNIGVGGAGKTPAAIAIGRRLASWGLMIAFLSRGYGGRLPGPVRVDTSKHGSADVGDEPLLLAEVGPAWVARERVDGARVAIAEGADVVIMDDGLQNPALAKDVSLVVVDGGYGFGNGRVLPAGPLREPVDSALRRATAVIVVGDDEHGIAQSIGTRRPALAARLRPAQNAAELRGRRVVAFAGIGRPAKFFATLVELGAEIVAREEFADHHAYTPDEAMRLAETAASVGAIAVTTAKDHVRLPVGARAMIARVDVELVFDDERAIDAILRPAFSNPTAGARSAHG
ncbi:MAG TPA: tetraacyldisaccharide 4'-kinase [Alphaproteobacteria bacterium]|nr:tetraacyldisaccharide 4'-kinase [Alphaproteobacteria bacterium]